MWFSKKRITIFFLILFFSFSFAAPSIFDISNNQLLVRETEPPNFQDILGNATVIVAGQNFVYSNNFTVSSGRQGKRLLPNMTSVNTEELNEKLGLSCIYESGVYNKDDCENCIFYEMFADESLVFGEERQLYTNEDLIPTIILRNIGKNKIETTVSLKLYYEEVGLVHNLFTVPLEYKVELYPDETTIFSTYTHIEEANAYAQRKGNYLFQADFDSELNFSTCNDAGGIGKLRSPTRIVKSFEVQSEFQKIQVEIQKEFLRFYEDMNRVSNENLQVSTDMKDILNENLEISKNLNTISDETLDLNRQVGYQNFLMFILTLAIGILTAINVFVSIKTPDKKHLEKLFMRNKKIEVLELIGKLNRATSPKSIKEYKEKLRQYVALGLVDLNYINSNLSDDKKV